SGTPSASGTFSFTVTATSGICSASQAYSVVICPSSVSFSPASLPNVIQGSTYNQTISQSTLTGTITWSISAGSLPTGLTLNSTTGAITGTATGFGNSNFTIQVSNGICSGTQTYGINVTCPTATLSPSTLPNVIQGASYNQTLTQTGLIGTLTWSVSIGSLPTGLTLNSTTGAITGTATGFGNNNFTIQVSNGTCSGTQTYSINVTCPTTMLSPSALPNVIQGASYNQTVTQIGLIGTLTWSVSVGTLPAGLTLNTSTGAITGTATGFGNSNFTTQVSNGTCSGTQTYSINVTCPTTTLNPSTLPNAIQGASYNQTLTQTGLSGTLTWSVSVGNLPAGLTLNSTTGAITGTATTLGTSNFTIQVSNGTCSGTQVFNSFLVEALSAPVATAATSIVTTGFTANWNAVSGATGYRLDVATDNAFTNFVAGYNNRTVTSTNEIISGATLLTNYFYRVRAVNGIATSANSNIITLQTTPLEDNYFGSLVTVYPNPARDLVTISISEQNYKLVELSILDNGGKLIKKITFDNKPEGIAVEVSKLAVGVYFFQIESRSSKTIKKVVKQ
ncbi:MAG: T9SS C-terminal target domain-containing protein, partial [Cytophagia bacterium]